MDLAETYQEVRRAVVAFVPRYGVATSPDASHPEFPPIVGTGFVVDDGLVATNDHVIRQLAKLPKPKEAPPEEWPFAVLLLHCIDEGVAEIPIEVLGVFAVGEIEVKGHYYGPRRPDIGFVHVKAKGLPKLPVSSTVLRLEEGRAVGTAGFPMGTDALTAPGYLHQMTPTLQQGIISAVLPFPCEKPHAFMVNIMTQGGASGSPVFPVDVPTAIGVLYAGLNDIGETLKIREPYIVPTAQSYVLPAHYLEHLLEKIRRDVTYQLPPDTPTLTEIISTYEREERSPRGAFGLKEESAPQETGSTLVRIVPGHPGS